MATKYLALLTNIGAAKLAKATALGTKVEITQLAVGDGNGVLPTPNPAQTALVHELRRAPLNMLTVDPANASQIIAEQVIPEDVGGWWIREIGLFDKDGDMVAIANCAETYKPQLQEGSGRVQVIRVILIVSSTEAVTLKIDPAVVLATRQYVDSQLRAHEQSRNHPDASTTEKGFVQLSSSVTSDSESQAATSKAVKIAMDNANARLAKERNLADLPNPALARQNLQLGDSSTKNTGTTANTVAAGDDARITGAMQKSQNGADIPDVAKFLQNLGLVDVLFKGDGRFLAGTFVSDAIDRTSIGARAATGCQFMRAHQAPDAPDQVSYWQVITLTEVVSPTSVVDVLAISGNNVVFGHGTGAGITSWRHVAMLEGAAFTGDISASNVRGGNSVTIGDGTGGLATGGVDGAGFNGNNMNVKSWDGIGFQNAADLVIRAYISTKLGIIAASESVYAGSAYLYKNGDVYGDKWSTGNGPNWLSLFLEHLDSQIRNDLTTWTTNNFPTKSDVSAALSLKPGRQYITQIGVYQNDKSKPFMLHDDDSGIFLAPSSSVHLDANGWHRDASTGLITQWGSGNVAGNQQQRVNFPMAFPNTCTTVIASDTGSGSIALSTMSKDNGGFTVRGASSTFGFNWFAMGY
ncbi:phage tail protein [Salmonella enterica subsp. enterica serovar Derby]|nr:phage tail protein [Salmonella enterica subsp. enterica serovar Derby]EGF7853034.1 phage tail protein [Salmonella enterica subsp. enterica serovar Schwarzengrund]ECM6877065.1 phage tail protein [Salmonella enterica subsp. enterica serovar Derby]EHE2646085.1 phage tail protein [Salmonella enterica subsp. enterica serovar Schwarzengrund]EHN0306395.1 phage tail protein [Salmonella enterica subsp. enterica serovar Schwarzengrund]